MEKFGYMYFENIKIGGTVMKEISSTAVVLEHTPSLNEMLSLHQFAKNYNGTIYLLANHHVIKIDELAKLVSFLLTVRDKQEMRIIVEGLRVQRTLKKLTVFFQNNQLNKYKSYKSIDSSLKISM